MSKRKMKLFQSHLSIKYFNSEFQEIYLMNKYIKSKYTGLSWHTFFKFP